MNKKGFFKRNLLKVITYLQEKTLVLNDIDFYMLLTKLHFKLSFGKNLVEEAVQGTSEYKMAEHRHVCMCHNLISSSKKFHPMYRNAFKSNLEVEARL